MLTARRRSTAPETRSTLVVLLDASRRWLRGEEECRPRLSRVFALCFHLPLIGCAASSTLRQPPALHRFPIVIPAPGALFMAWLSDSPE
jgi:hypothetical protein